MPPNFDKEVNNACFRFVWNFKPDKMKRHTLIGPFDKGGLQMVDFSMADKALKAAWVKRLYESKDCSWCALFFSALRKYGSNLLLESNYNVEDLDLTKVPAFYKTVLTVWQDLHSKAPSDAKEYTSEILWNNRFIKIDGRPIYYASWHEKGVTTIGDLLDENKKFLTYKSLLDKFDLRTNFLTYNGVVAAIPKSWKESIQRRCIALQNVKTTRNNLSVTNITAKKSRIVLANDAFIPPNVEFNLINMHRNPILT